MGIKPSMSEVNKTVGRGKVCQPNKPHAKEKKPRGLKHNAV